MSAYYGGRRFMVGREKITFKNFYFLNRFIVIITRIKQKAQMFRDPYYRQKLKSNEN